MPFLEWGILEGSGFAVGEVFKIFFFIHSSFTDM